jgi:anti-sigma B factor antagonist
MTDMFSVELTIRHVNGFAVVALSGELDLVDTPAVASQLIATVAESGSIIVDLTDLAYISCGGLGVLVRVLNLTRVRDRALLLVAPQGMVRVILEVTGLVDVFSVYPTVQQALNTAALARPLVSS